MPTHTAQTSVRLDNRIKAKSDNRAYTGAHYIEEYLRKQGASISFLPAVDNLTLIKDASMTERYGVCEL